MTDLLYTSLDQIVYREEMQNVFLDLERADLVSKVLKGQLNRLETAANLGVELTKQTSHFVGLEKLTDALEELVYTSIFFLHKYLQILTP